MDAVRGTSYQGAALDGSAFSFCDAERSDEVNEVSLVAESKHPYPNLTTDFVSDGRDASTPQRGFALLASAAVSMTAVSTCYRR